MKKVSSFSAIANLLTSIFLSFLQKPTLGKKAKSPKPARKSTPTSEQTPEPSLDVIPTVDENLLKMIENQNGSLELSEETLNEFAPVEDFQDQDVLSLEDNSIKTSGKPWERS